MLKHWLNNCRLIPFAYFYKVFLFVCNNWIYYVQFKLYQFTAPTSGTPINLPTNNHQQLFAPSAAFQSAPSHQQLLVGTALNRELCARMRDKIITKCTPRYKSPRQCQYHHFANRAASSPPIASWTPGCCVYLPLTAALSWSPPEGSKLCIHQESFSLLLLLCIADSYHYLFFISSL